MISFEIAAVSQISLSEIQKVRPEVTLEWIENNKKEFDGILTSLGMDVNYLVDWQDTTHRNRFGEVVTCMRFVGEERRDYQWLNSGHASEAAIDRGLDNKLLNDLKRLQGLVKE